MDTDRPSTLNYDKQSPHRSSIWSTRSSSTLFTLPSSQANGASDRNNSSQPFGLTSPWNFHLHRLATDSDLRAAETRYNNWFPRLFHHIFDLFSGECSADQSRSNAASSIQYPTSNNQRPLPLITRNLDRQPALSFLKKTSTSSNTNGQEEIQEDNKEQKEPRRFFCKNCKQWIAFVSDTIQVNDIPTLTLQINPHGFVHEVITVKYVVNSLIAGPPVPADTWFPGYEWRFLICQQCQSHLGWSYHQPQETAMSFAGLRKASIFEE